MNNNMKLFAAAIKKGNPAITDEQAQRAWDEVNAKTNGQLVNMPPNQLSTLAYKISSGIKQQSNKPGFANGGAVDTLPAQTIVGKREFTPSPAPITGLPTQVPPNIASDPQMLQNQLKIMLANQGNSLKLEREQDPDYVNSQREKAVSDYQRLRDDQAGSRMIGSILAGGAAGSSGGASVTANDGAWESIDKRNKFLTTDQATAKQKDMLDMYKAGREKNDALVASIGTMQNNAIKSAKDSSDLALALKDNEFKTQSYDPNSLQSQGARIALRNALKSVGRYTDAQILQMVPNSLTSIEAQPLLSSLVDKPVELMKALSAKNLTDAQRQQALAAAAASSASAGKTREETRGVELENQLARATNKTIIDPTTGGLSNSSGAVPTVSGGKTSITFPETQKRAEGKGEAAVSSEARGRMYEVSLKPVVDRTLAKLELVGSGKGTAAIASIWPGNEQQELISLLNQVNSLYPGSLPPELGSRLTANANKPGFNGSLIAAMTKDQLKRALEAVNSTFERDRTYQNNVDSGGRPGSAPTTGGVTPYETYTKLPKGATYVGPDGLTYTKE